MNSTYYDIEQQIIKLGEMLGDKPKDEVQEHLNQLVKGIGYNSVSGKARFDIKVVKNEKRT